jgi:hypothetical protein
MHTHNHDHKHEHVPPGAWDALCAKHDRAVDVIVRYVNALGPHMTEAWKEEIVKACDLEVDEGNPYRPVQRKRPACAEAATATLDHLRLESALPKP